MLKKIVLIVLILFITGSNICYAMPSFSLTVSNNDNINMEHSRAVLGNALAANAPVFNLKAKGAVLMELKSGDVIYSQMENEKVFPASTTKIMTMLLVFEAIENGKINIDDKVVISEHASTMGGSQVWAKPGEQFTVYEALKAISVASANDMCIAVAEHISGNTDNFVAQMNQEAKRIGMNNTNFINPHGLDDTNHYTTAYDMALLSREIILKYPQVFNYTSIWMDSLRDGAFGLSNTNKLLKTYSGVNGLKTGSTSIAGYSICASATKNDMTLLSIIMSDVDSETRFNEAKQLFDYGFNNFKILELNNTDKEYSKIKVQKGDIEDLNLLYQKTTVKVLDKGLKGEVKTRVNLPKEIFAPIKRGDIVGNIEYLLNDKVISSVNIVSGEDVKKANVFKNSYKIIQEIIRR